MGSILHRVDSKRAPKAPPVLPVDAWQGGTFVEASGDEWVVIWGGVGPLPWQLDWPSWLVARTEGETRGMIRLTSSRGRSNAGS